MGGRGRQLVDECWLVQLAEAKPELRPGVLSFLDACWLQLWQRYTRPVAALLWQLYSHPVYTVFPATVPCICCLLLVVSMLG